MDLKTTILGRKAMRGPTPRLVKRAPRQAYPSGIELDYARALLAYVAELQMVIDEDLLPQLPALEATAKAEGLRSDAFPDDVDIIAERMRRRMEARQRITERRAEEAATRISSFNRNQIAGQVKAVLGVDVFAAEPWLRSEMAVWTRENARLIQSISDKAIDGVDRIVTDGIRDGKAIRTLTAEIRKEIGSTRSRATLIARDQVGKFNGRLTQLRHRDMGVTDYTWRGVMDGRERPAHVRREGQRFSWDSPPPDGHPGQPIQCRCTAEPVLDEFADLMGVGEPSVKDNGTPQAANGKLAGMQPNKSNATDYAIAKPGTHFRSVDSPLERSETYTALSGMKDAGLVPFLRQNPIGDIAFVREAYTPDRRRIMGSYRRYDRFLTLAYGEPVGGWGQELKPGETFGVALTARNRKEHLKMVFVHELGHHVLNVVGKAGWEIIDNALAERRRHISLYASTRDDYFSESLVAFVYHPDVLMSYDRVGYDMVQEVLKLTKIGGGE
jgi:SPP1 gp7 family putative phage head morphogenesis protein